MQRPLTATRLPLNLAPTCSVLEILQQKGVADPKLVGDPALESTGSAHEFETPCSLYRMKYLAGFARPSSRAFSHRLDSLARQVRPRSLLPQDKRVIVKTGIISIRESCPLTLVQFLVDLVSGPDIQLTIHCRQVWGGRSSWSLVSGLRMPFKNSKTGLTGGSTWQCESVWSSNRMQRTKIPCKKDSVEPGLVDNAVAYQGCVLTRSPDVRCPPSPLAGLDLDSTTASGRNQLTARIVHFRREAMTEKRMPGRSSFGNVSICDFVASRPSHERFNNRVPYING